LRDGEVTVQKSFYPKAEDLNPEWLLVNADGQNLGRVATKIASLLLGKHKPTFTPGTECGDMVIVINAQNVQVTGKKLEVKMYHHHSLYPGGLTSISLRHQLERHPDRVIRSAVWGMLPHNKRGRQLIKRLKIYAGAEHPHQAQQPTEVA
jgi:large subunit ribosomal protein L13